MGQHATDIVGYTFNADTYCPDHIVGALPTGEGETYDGWALGGRPPVRMSTEDNLSELALAFGITREDEHTFDSGEFPKVIFADSAWDAASQGYGDVCATCGQPLVEADVSSSASRQHYIDTGE